MTMANHNSLNILKMDRDFSGFRSGPSRKACWLLIVNKTYRTVNVIWLDYNGKEKNYGIVAPKSIKSIHSYEGHPWLCRDTFSKRRLLLNNVDIFIPRRAAPNPNQPADSFPILKVNISLPLFSLQDICADAISRCVFSEKDIHTLEIPIRMKELIVDCFHNCTSF